MVQPSGVLTCPLCSRTHSMPVQGIHGFRTDYHLENLLEHRQIKFTLETKAMHDCVGCSTKQKIAAYCFKCKGFLCQRCLQFHLTNRMVADHQNKLLSTEEFETKGFDLQTYSRLKESPTCFFHPDIPTHQCCVTCNSIWLCTLCSSTNHNGHTLNEFKTLTTDERNQLDKIKEDLRKCKQRFESVVKSIEATSCTTNTNPTSTTNHCQSGMRKIKEQIVKKKEKMEKEKSSLNIEMGVEIKRVTEEYDKKIQSMENEVKKKIEALQQQHDSQVKELNDQHDQLQKRIKEEEKRVRQRNESRANELSKLKEDSKKLRDRIKDFNLTVTTVHAMGNDWTASEYLPDIKTSYKVLIDDANNMFVRLNSLTNNDVSQSTSGSTSKVHSFGPFLCKFSAVEITDMKNTTQKIHSIASCGNGHFAITGYDSRNFSFLSLVDLNGKLVRTIKTSERNVLPACFCATWSASKVVTVSKVNLIGIFDIRDSSYMQKDITSMLKWNPTWKLTCVDTDPIKNLLYVGGSNQKIYVFDDLLGFKHSLDLPETVKSVSHIAVLEGAIVVCDKMSKGVYMLARQQDTVLSVINKLQPPSLDGDDYCPLKVSADKQGFIFTLWSTKISEKPCRICAKYSKDGIKLLAAGKLDRLEEIITVMTTPEGKQKLVMSTGKSNKLFLYEFSTQGQTTSGIPNRGTEENPRSLQVTVPNGYRRVSLPTENQRKRGHSPSVEANKRHPSPKSPRTISSTSYNARTLSSDLRIPSTSTGGAFSSTENIIQGHPHSTGPQSNQNIQFHHR